LGYYDDFFDCSTGMLNVFMVCFNEPCLSLGNRDKSERRRGLNILRKATQWRGLEKTTSPGNDQNANVERAAYICIYLERLAHGRVVKAASRPLPFLSSKLRISDNITS
jgi:hypothetical protein